jgi:hypothetical protein
VQGAALGHRRAACNVYVDEIVNCQQRSMHPTPRASRPCVFLYPRASRPNVEPPGRRKPPNIKLDDMTREMNPWGRFGRQQGVNSFACQRPFSRGFSREASECLLQPFQVCSSSTTGNFPSKFRGACASAAAAAPCAAGTLRSQAAQKTRRGPFWKSCLLFPKSETSQRDINTRGARDARGPAPRDGRSLPSTGCSAGGAFNRTN